MDLATTSREDEDWELRNDAGFVYKRKKRRRLDPAATTSHVSSSADEDQFQETTQKQRRERKKKTLLKLKARYRTEIPHWDFLSNTLRAMEETALQLYSQRRRTPSPASSPSMYDSVGGSMVDELLLQVEAQEAIIHNISCLCDAAEAMCHKHEQQFRQLLFDLPIWASPLELMELLCLCDE